MPKYKAHVPTRYMTQIDVEADNKAEAIAKLKEMEGEFDTAVFVEFLLDELDEDCLDEQREPQ